MRIKAGFSLLITSLHCCKLTIPKILVKFYHFSKQRQKIYLYKQTCFLIISSMTWLNFFLNHPCLMHDQVSSFFHFLTLHFPHFNPSTTHSEYTSIILWKKDLHKFYLNGLSKNNYCYCQESCEYSQIIINFYTKFTLSTLGALSSNPHSLPSVH